jgi:Flp pilus assembly protein CpaB
VGRRWSRASRVYAAASLACAALAGASANAYLGRAAAASGLAGPPATVVVARTAIARGAIVQADALHATRMPSAFAPPGALDRVSQAAGRVALAALAPGEVVTETRLARVREGPVASLTPEGLRAFAVPSSLPRGAVAAGDHVDVLATYTSGQPHTEVAASDVQVLTVLGPPAASGGASAGLSGVPGAGEAQSLLVLVISPDQEEQLASATAFAALSIAVV